MRTIKTYTNGRFYDTLDKKYIRQEELVARLEKKGSHRDYHAQDR